MKKSYLGFVAVVFMAITTRAGVPEPGIILYGVVSNLTDATRATSGIIVWTYSNSVDGAISVTGSLSNIGGQFSYSLTIPFETSITNEPAINALPLRTNLTTYTRFCRVDGVPAAIAAPAGNSDTNSASTRGAFKRVDLQVSLPAGDSDGDGIPDWYEQAYGLNAAVSNSPSADFDGDGMSDLDEFRAGMAANSTSSVLQMESLNTMTGAPGRVVLTWQSASNKYYSIHRTTNLLASFVPIVSNIVATPPANIYTDQPPVGVSYYYKVGSQP